MTIQYTTTILLRQTYKCNGLSGFPSFLMLVVEFLQDTIFGRGCFVQRLMYMYALSLFPPRSHSTQLPVSTGFTIPMYPVPGYPSNFLVFQGLGLGVWRELAGCLPGLKPGHPAVLCFVCIVYVCAYTIHTKHRIGLKAGHPAVLCFVCIVYAQTLYVVYFMS